MKYPVYAYRDVKVGFGALQLFLNDAVARRKFAQDVNQSGSALEFAPGDYELYHVADYETNNGQLSPVWPTVFICSGNDVAGGAYNG